MNIQIVDTRNEMDTAKIDHTDGDNAPGPIADAIQPHGALIALSLDQSFIITHASENLADLIGIEPGAALGQPFSILLDEIDSARLADRIADLEDRAAAVYLDTVRARCGGRLVDALAHRSNGHLIIEFEPAGDDSRSPDTNLHRLTHTAVGLFRAGGSLAEVQQACTRRIREIAGFDRVMIDRFDENGNGTVIAEDRRTDLEPFVGRLDPAANGASAARQSFTQDRVRFIADCRYIPARIVSSAGPDVAARLDISNSVLRGVSLVHLEYLRGIGVGASMSIPLFKDGQLWGSIECHHGSPRHVPHDIRTACELLGEMMSLHLEAREKSSERGVYQERVNSIQATIAARRGDAEKEHTDLLASERAARGEAERHSRMKDEFVATLSHELRTPLNAIFGWTQILRHTQDAEAVKEASEVIERNARVQAKMIEDLLDISRIISGKLRLDVRTVDLMAVITAALDKAAPAAEAKGVRIERLFDPLLGLRLTGDSARLQQVFSHLLSNAVKFTPRGGKIQTDVESDGSRVEIGISDSGEGIEPEFLPHIFDRFRQQDAATNRQYGGLGLGLSIVRHLVELHGGTIFARSPGSGQGSFFVVSLPLPIATPFEQRVDGHRSSSARPIVGGLLDLRETRILVVDDEPDAREMMRRILETRRATVSTAGSADEALELFRVNEFDVVISDIGMPKVDGYEFIKIVRQLEVAQGRSPTPAVAVTAYTRPEDRHRVLLAGYQLHVAKPVEPAEIAAVIASLVRAH